MDPTVEVGMDTDLNGNGEMAGDSVDKMNSSSSSSSSSSSDAADALEKARQDLEAAPQSYDAHATLVRALRSTQDLEALRVARWNFARMFPLPPSLWLEWIRDEVGLAVSSADRAAIAEGVMEGAVGDYLSVEVHIERLRFEIERYKAGEGSLEDVQACWADAEREGATAHFGQSAVLWRLYLDFLPEAGIEAGTVERMAAKMAEIPFSGVENEKDTELVAECEMFERKLIEAGSEPENETGIRDEELKLQYQSYATHAAANGTASAKERAYGIWARCVAECFLDAQIWAKCAKFCEISGFRERYALVVSRATRSVPWDLEMWRKSLVLCLERDTGSLPESFLTKLAQATPHVMSSDDLHGAERIAKFVLTAYRLMGLPSGSEEAFDAVLNFNEVGTEQWASTMCLAVSSSHRDYSSRIEKMEQIVQNRPTEARWWISYLHLLTQQPSETSETAAADLVRQVLQRAVSAVQSPHQLGLIDCAWFEFEAEHASSLDDYKKAVDCVSKRWGEVSVARPPRTGARGVRGRGDGSKASKKRARPSPTQKRKKANVDKTAIEQRESVPAKGPVVSTAANGTPEPTGKQVATVEATATVEPAGAGGASSAPSFEPNTVFVRNMPFKVTERDLRGAFEFAGAIRGIRIPHRSDGASKGFAYIEFEKDSDVVKALTMNNRPLLGREMWVKRSAPPRKFRDGAAHSAHAVPPRSGQRRNPTIMRPRVVERRTTLHAPTTPVTEPRDTVMQDAENTGSGENEDMIAPEPTRDLKQSDFRSMILAPKEPKQKH